MPSPRNDIGAWTAAFASIGRAQAATCPVCQLVGRSILHT
jgi:hypothetical protein